MKTIHYIVLGAKSPLGRTYIQNLAAQGVSPDNVAAIDLKAGAMSWDDDTDLKIQDAELYKQIPNRNEALHVLADGKAALIDIADDHLDDDGRLLDLTGHFLKDSDAVLAPADGKLVVQPSAAARVIDTFVKALPSAPSKLHLTVFLPASHFGRDGMDELYNQVRQFLVADELDNSVFPKKLAFNVLPFAGALNDDGGSAEEIKLHAELQKLLPGVQTSVTCVVVPVFIGLGITVSAEFGSTMSAQSASLSLRRQRALRLIDPQSELMAASPAEIAGDDLISVSRLRDNDGMPNSISCWLAADNTL